MLLLNNIRPDFGSRKKSKRVWRWNWSKWTFCGRWMNGQNSRSWGWVGPWFEWGQTPLFRRMPKLKGFSNANFTRSYNEVNVSSLELLASKGITTIDKDVLLANRIIRDKNLDVKVLGDGEISSKITLKVTKLTKQAMEKIQKAGWTVELV